MGLVLVVGVNCFPQDSFLGLPCIWYTVPGTHLSRAPFSFDACLFIGNLGQLALKEPLRINEATLGLSKFVGVRLCYKVEIFAAFVRLQNTATLLFCHCLVGGDSSAVVNWLNSRS